MTIRADTSGADDLAHDFDLAAARIGDDVYAIVKRGANNIKTDWRRRAKVSAGEHGRLYPLSIGYDIARIGDRTDAEIGPDSMKPQGGMGRGFEYGSVNSAPKPDGTTAAATEEPKFIAQIEAAVAKLLH